MINLGCMDQIYDIKSSIFLEKLESVTSGLDCGRLFIARHMQIDKKKPQKLIPIEYNQSQTEITKLDTVIFGLLNATGE